MATLELLQSEMIKAMKNKDKVRKLALSEMIDAAQKAAMTPKGRLVITEELVNEALIKHQNTVQEMVDTCPKDRVERLAEYQANLEIVKEFAPQLITDAAEIKEMILNILNNKYDLTKKNRGSIMKAIMPTLKGKVDMATANKVISSMLV